MTIQSTSKKGVLYALGFVALAATSVSVFAESTEFRRGYQEGFRDARQGNDQQYGQYQGNQGNHRITIDRARYGVRGKTCNAETTLQNAINSRNTKTGNNGRYGNNNDRRRSFSVVANNQLCGDPAPNQVKQLDVRYRCGNGGEPTQVRAAEGNTLRMDC